MPGGGTARAGDHRAPGRGRDRRARRRRPADDDLPVPARRAAAPVGDARRPARRRGRGRAGDGPPRAGTRRSGLAARRVVGADRRRSVAGLLRRERAGLPGDAGSPTSAAPTSGDDEEADLETHWVALADAVAMVFDGPIVNAGHGGGGARRARRSGVARGPRPPTRPGRTGRPGSRRASRRPVLGLGAHALRTVRPPGLAARPRRHRARRAVGGDEGPRPARRRGPVGVDLGLRPLPHRAACPPTRPRTRRGP